MLIPLVGTLVALWQAEKQLLGKDHGFQQSCAALKKDTEIPSLGLEPHTIFSLDLDFDRGSLSDLRSSSQKSALELDRYSYVMPRSFVELLGDIADERVQVFIRHGLFLIALWH